MDLPEIFGRMLAFGKETGHIAVTYSDSSRFERLWSDLIEQEIGFGYCLRDPDQRMTGVLIAMKGPDPITGDLVVQEIFMDADPDEKRVLTLFSAFEKHARAIGAKRVASGHPLCERGERHARFLRAKRYLPVETWYLKEL